MNEPPTHRPINKIKIFPTVSDDGCLRPTWLPTTCATRCRSVSGVKTSAAKRSRFRYSVGFFFSATSRSQFCGEMKQLVIRARRIRAERAAAVHRAHL
jgi:hypothetical protein